MVTAGRVDEAITQFRRAVELSGGRAEARFNLGAALVQKGLFDEALEQIDAGLAQKPLFPTAHFFKALALSGKGNTKEAIPGICRSGASKTRLHGRP